MHCPSANAQRLQRPIPQMTLVWLPLQLLLLLCCAGQAGAEAIPFPRVLGEHLAFDSQDHFHSVMIDLAAQQEAADEEGLGAEPFAGYTESLGFHSLAADVNQRVAVLERQGGVTEENDPDEHFVPDPYLRHLLNPQSEVVIADTIYRLESDGEYSIAGLDYNALEQIRQGQIRQGQSGSGDHVRYRAYPKSRVGCCHVFKIDTHYHMYPGDKRRTKNKQWTVFYFFYASIGAKTRHYRHTGNGWSTDPAAKIHVWGKYDQYPCDSPIPKSFSKTKTNDSSVAYVAAYNYGIAGRFDSNHLAAEAGEKRLAFRAETYAESNWAQFDGGDRRLDVNRMCCTRDHRWRASEGAAANWTDLANSCLSISDLAFGDFDSDGIADIFYPDGTSWWLSPGGVSPWQQLATSGYGINSLAFGDFDGNGVTDVFRATGTEWLVSFNGNGPWTVHATSGYGIDSLEFGDFDGDGRTDVFRATGTEWLVSFGGNGPWIHRATSGFTVNQLAFGDFNGDQRTDVFRTSGGQWFISFSANSAWTPVATSSASLDRLAFGDFDGDNRTDVFITSSGQWFTSSAAANNWQGLATSGLRFEEMGFGVFLGSPVSDVFWSGF